MKITRENISKVSREALEAEYWKQVRINSNLTTLNRNMWNNYQDASKDLHTLEEEREIIKDLLRSE